MANIRFVLSSTASILYSSCQVKQDEAEAQISKKLFAFLMKFISKVRNSEMHMFFLREIIRRYGLRELDNVVKETEFTWLNLDREDESHVSIIFCILSLCTCKFVCWCVHVYVNGNM